MADRFKAVSPCRSCEKRGYRQTHTQTDAEARGAQSGLLGTAVKGCPRSGFCLSGLFSMRPCGREEDGRDPTTAQMRCRGRRRRPRPAGPALCAVLPSHRGGTHRPRGRLRLFIVSRSFSQEDRTNTGGTRTTGLTCARELSPSFGLSVETRERLRCAHVKTSTPNFLTPFLTPQ